MTWAFPTEDLSHPAAVVATAAFEPDEDDPIPGPDSAVLATTDHPRTERGSLASHNGAKTDRPVTATRTVTGLTIGQTYTLSAWVNNAHGNAIENATIGVAGIGTAAPVTPTPGYAKSAYAFTATATSQDLTLSYDAPDGEAESNVWWDDTTLTEDAWTEHPAASTVADPVTRSQSGRIIANTLTDGALLLSPSTHRFDAAGRPITATIPRHTLTYPTRLHRWVRCATWQPEERQPDRVLQTPSYSGTPTTVGYCFMTTRIGSPHTTVRCSVRAGPVAGGT